MNPYQRYFKGKKTQYHVYASQSVTPVFASSSTQQWKNEGKELNLTFDVFVVQLGTLPFEVALNPVCEKMESRQGYPVFARLSISIRQAESPIQLTISEKNALRLQMQEFLLPLLSKFNLQVIGSSLLGSRLDLMFYCSEEESTDIEVFTKEFSRLHQAGPCTWGDLRLQFDPEWKMVFPFYASYSKLKNAEKN